MAHMSQGDRAHDLWSLNFCRSCPRDTERETAQQPKGNTSRWGIVHMKKFHCCPWCKTCLAGMHCMPHW